MSFVRYFLVIISIYSSYSYNQARYDIELLKEKQNIVPIAILGSGPAGLSAGLYGARGGFHTVVFQGSKPGGQLVDASIIENWPGMPPTRGSLAIKKLEKQAQRFGAVIVPQDIKQVDFSSWPFKLTTDNNTALHALSVIIATGANPKKLNIPGEQEYWGRGVLSCTVCDAPLSKNKDVIVIGQDSATFERILQLIPYAQSITLIVHNNAEHKLKNVLNKLKGLNKVHVVTNKTIKEIVGDGKQVTGISLVDSETGEPLHIKADMIYLSVGFQPNSELFARQLALDKKQCIEIQAGCQKTSQEGVFAAGNVTDSRYHQAGIAAGEGSKAALDAIHFLNKLECEGPLEKAIEPLLYKPAQIAKAKKKQLIVPSVEQIDNPEQFAQKILKNNTIILLECYSPTCPHCTNMKQTFDEIAHKGKKKFTSYKIDVNKMGKAAQQLGISSLPTFLLLKNGKELGRISGEMPKRKLSQFINKTVRAYENNRF